MKLLLLLFLPLSACQYHGKSNVLPLPEIRDLMRENDRGEYYSLLYACKTIRDTQTAIADVRMSVDDCIAQAITNYLRNVNSLASQVLLKDLQSKNFRME